METLHLDLSENATRRHILSLLQGMLAESADEVQQAAENAGVPERHHHDLPEVLATIADLRAVSPQVRDNMRAIYQILAEAEAQAHNCSVDETHFHEVGNAEAIRCVLQICLCIERLAPERIVATRVQVGSGQIECAHGTLDVPAPATAAIIARGIPVCDEKLEGELCTPTSAAVILHFVDEFEGAAELA